MTFFDSKIRHLIALGIIGLLFLPSFACGGRGGGNVRPTKEKTIVGNTPDGYEPAVARDLGFWSSRFQIMNYAMMSRAGITTTIEDGEINFLKYLAEPSNGLDPATVPTNAAYIKVPYRYALPQYSSADNGQFLDFLDEQWASAEQSSGYDTLATAYLVMSETELARQFHSEVAFGNPETATQGSTERLQGLILLELAKRQVLNYINNRSSYSSTVAGNLKMMASLANLVRLLRVPTIDGLENRYRDVNFSSQIMVWIDYIFDEYTDNPSPSTPAGLCEAILSLGYYVTTTLDSSLREQGITLITNYADSLTNISDSDSFGMACQIRGLVEAGRLLFKNSYYSQAGEIFELMQANYVPQTGVFKDRQTLSSYEVSMIISSLNALNHLAFAYSDGYWAELIMSDFIASSVYMSRMQASTYPISVVSDFEKPSNPLHFSFPGIPINRASGLGVAPYFCSQISQTAGANGWEVTNTTFDAVGALSLALEMLWLRPDDFNPYPSYSGGISQALRFGRNDYTFPVATTNAYYTGRTAAVEFSLRSAIGDTFEISPDVVANIVGQTTSPETGDAISYPLNPSTLRIPFTHGNPAFLSKNNGNSSDYSNYRWTLSGSTIDDSSLASLILLEAKLAMHFHDDNRFGIKGVSSFGAAERLKGMMLYRAIKQQILDLSTSSYTIPRTFHGRCKLIEALCEVAHMSGSATIENSTTNRYFDPDLSLTTNSLLEQAYLFIASHSNPDNLNDLALYSRAMFTYALQVADFDRAQAAKRKVLSLADSALDFQLANSIDKSDLIIILINALRLGGSGELRAELHKAFIQLIGEYDTYYGTFASKNRYSLNECATILEALVLAYKFDDSIIDHEACEHITRGFIEGSFMLSGLVRSSWVAWEYPYHERIGLTDIHFRYPTLPYPLYAGGENGIAPVFARQIEFVSFGGFWNVLDTLSHTSSLLHASEALLLCNIDAFPLPQVPSHLE